MASAAQEGDRLPRPLPAISSKFSKKYLPTFTSSFERTSVLGVAISLGQGALTSHTCWGAVCVVLEWGLCECPGAAVTKHHRPHSSKLQKCIFSHCSRGPEVQNQGVGRLVPRESPSQAALQCPVVPALLGLPRPWPRHPVLASVITWRSLPLSSLRGH